MRSTKFLALTGAVGVLVGTTVMTAGASVDENKTFAVTATSVSAGDADAGVTLTVTNLSPNQSLGSVNIGVPAPLRVVSAVDADPATPQLIELRNLALQPGSSASFAVTVDVQWCTPGSPVLTADAKQSNDYNGTGNDFTLATPSSDLVVDILGSCSLRWVAQPSGAERTAVITSTPFLATGPAVQIEVLDASTTPQRATSSAAPITLTVRNATLPQATVDAALGGATATATGGVATFRPTLSLSADGYTLTGTSTGLTPTPASVPFSVVDDAAPCTATGCTARSQAGNATAEASFGTGGSSTALLVSIQAADTPAFSCAGYPRSADLPVTQFSFTGDLGGDRLGTSTTRLRNATRPLNAYEVCWAAPYDFVTESGTRAPLSSATKPGTAIPLYVGLLADCPRRTDIATADANGLLPCVAGRTFDRTTREVVISVWTTGDDPWRY